MINYSEFISATIDLSKYLTDEKLDALFKDFDVDNSGSIAAKEIKDAFSRFNREVSDEEVAEIFKQHDKDQN